MTKQWHLRVRDTMMAEAAGCQEVKVALRDAWVKYGASVRCRIHDQNIFTMHGISTAVAECIQFPLGSIWFARETPPEQQHD